MEATAKVRHLRVTPMKARRVVDLVRLLDQVGAQRVVRLRPIPLASTPEVAHQRERIFKCGLGLHRLHRLL